MRKSWFIVMLVGFLVGQSPLASSVVLCITEDGHAHLEATDHHDHGHVHVESHYETCHTDTCEIYARPGHCCEDVALDCVNPTLVEAKRLAKNTQVSSRVVVQNKVLPVESTFSISSNLHHTEPVALRSVILLI